jgi:hypothetical protein
MVPSESRGVLDQGCGVWCRRECYGPPAQFNKGAHLVGEATDANILLLKQWLFSFLAASGLGTVIPGQRSIGLYCTPFQSLNIGSFMACMEIDLPWFREVAEHGALLQGPLATLVTPLRPGDGLCAAVSIRSRLWP